MRIDGVDNGLRASGAAAGMGATAAGQAGGASFTDMLDSALEGLRSVEQQSTDAVEKLATGEQIDIHDVVLATEAESLAFQLMLTVRNKLMEAYQEVIRMQV